MTNHDDWITEQERAAAAEAERLALDRQRFAVDDEWPDVDVRVVRGTQALADALAQRWLSSNGPWR